MKHSTEVSRPQRWRMTLLMWDESSESQRTAPHMHEHVKVEAPGGPHAVHTPPGYQSGQPTELSSSHQGGDSFLSVHGKCGN